MKPRHSPQTAHARMGIDIWSQGLVVFILLMTASASVAEDPNKCIQITCPEPIIVECDLPGGTYVQYGLQAESLCESTLTVVCTPESGTLFAPGETVVTCDVNDELGNTATCSFSVFVLDSTPPEIEAPQDFEVACQSWMGAVVSWSASATDQCDGPVSLTCDPPSGSLLPNGRTLVTCRAEDSAGNRSQHSFTVMVTGDCGSNCVAIVCPPDITADTVTGNEVAVNYTVTATHSCGGTVSVVCDPPSGSLFGVGTTTVACHGDDGQGNGTSCSFQVIVRDGMAPELILPGPIIVNCDQEDAVTLARLPFTEGERFFRLRQR